MQPANTRTLNEPRQLTEDETAALRAEAAEVYGRRPAVVAAKPPAVAEPVVGKGGTPPRVDDRWLDEPWEDLAKRPPGYLLNRKATLCRQGREADIWWRVGSDGEAAMAAALEGLTRPGQLARAARGSTSVPWRVLHSVGIGTGLGDLDHVLIGPPGVVIVDTKNHDPRRRVLVEDSGMAVGGDPVTHTAKVVADAHRARRLLLTALNAVLDRRVADPGRKWPDGWRLRSPALALETLADENMAGVGGVQWPPVTPAIGLPRARPRVHGRPRGVLIGTASTLPRALTAMPRQITQAQGDALYEVLRRSTTWTRDL